MPVVFLRFLRFLLFVVFSALSASSAVNPIAAKRKRSQPPRLPPRAGFPLSALGF